MPTVLLITAFPPQPGSGWVRTQALCKWLQRKGWHVVLLAPPLAVEKPHGAKVIQIGYWNPKKALRALTRANAPFVMDPPPTDEVAGSARRRAVSAVGSLLSFPDEFALWTGPAVVAGVRMVRRFNPDVVLSSSPRPTAHVVASLVSRIGDTPWVADYRDLWVGNPYTRTGVVRNRVDRLLEDAVVRRATSITTVTDPMAELLRHRFGSAARQVSTISNGFDPEEWADVPFSDGEDGKFVLLYAGLLYGGARDLSPLLRALARLIERGDIERSTVGVHLYGGPPGNLMATAEELGLESVVHYGGRVERSVVLRRMRQAGILLLPLDADPSVRPAKVFEYVAAGRPILAIGNAMNAAARVVEETNAGVVTCDEMEIQRAILHWYGGWQQTGQLPMTVVQGTEAYTHEWMAARFDSVLRQAAGI